MTIQELIKNKVFQYSAGGIALTALTLAVTFTSILPSTSTLQANTISATSYVTCSGKLDPKTNAGEAIKVTWTISAANLPDSVRDKMQVETEGTPLKSWSYCIDNQNNDNVACGGSMKSTPATVKISSTYSSADRNTTKTMKPYIKYVYDLSDYDSEEKLFLSADDIINGANCSLKLLQDDAPPPAAPTYKSVIKTADAADPSKYLVTVEWNTVSGATSYKIKSSTSAAGPWTTLYSNSGVPKITQKLGPGTYFYTITATKYGTESANATPVGVTIAAPAPPPPGTLAAPTGLYAWPATKNAANPLKYDVLLTWNQVAGATGYKIKSSQISGGPYATVLSPTSSVCANNVCSAVFYLVDPGTYYDVVSATKTGVESANSAQITAVIGAMAQPNPVNPPSPPPSIPVSDSDGDGLKDNVDDCPNQAANTTDGCPEPVTPPPTPTPTPQAQQQVQSQGSQEEAALKPALNIMTCKAGGTVLNRATGAPIYVHCGFTQASIVNAFVVSGDYDPKQTPTEDNKVKVFLTDESQPMKPLVVTWDGVNDYDTAVKNGEYSLVVSAVPSKSYTPDYSILKFTVTDEPLPQPTQEETTTPGTTTDVPSASEPLSPAAPEEPAAPPEPSKCPGVNYPTDIKGHWAENFIKASYDACLLTGYRDGTFRPNQNITRAETVKLTLAATDVQPKVCFDNDCGSPYSDLDTWQGPWIRPAWDSKVVNKTGTHFEPNRAITRAEAASIVVKGFKFPIPAFCYTANCGAGFPDNFFMDIKQAWQGPYIRSLWDKKVVQGTTPGMFEPNRAITRAELTKMVISSRVAVTEATPATPPAATTPPPGSTQE